MAINKDFAELDAVLLRVLADFPGGIHKSRACELVIRQYAKAPLDWDTQIPTGAAEDVVNRLVPGGDWRDIPQADLVKICAANKIKMDLKFNNQIAWSRNRLRSNGFIDQSVPLGTWCLNEDGFNAARATAVVRPRVEDESVPVLKNSIMGKMNFMTREQLAALLRSAEAIMGGPN